MHAGLANDLFSSLKVEHGPPALLGRFFLKAEALVHACGVALEFAPMTALLEANKANRETWLPLISIFDPTWSRLDQDNAFCILGRDKSGAIVATQAGRFLDLSQSSFGAVCEDLTLYYADPAAALPGERCTASAPEAWTTLTGRVLFSGAAWYHPNLRGAGLSRILPRLSRLYGLTRWNTDHTVTMMGEANMARRVNERNGYRHAAWSIDIASSHYGTARMALLWNTTADTLDDATDFVDRLGDHVARDLAARRVR
jgi:hypothetical protein